MSMLLARPQGPLSDGAPLSYGGSLPLENYEAMNGPVQDLPQFDPSQLLRRESLGLAQIYKDKIRYLGITGSSMILTTHNASIISRAFPIVTVEDETFTYEKRVDDRTFAERASERSLPSTVSSHTEMVTVSLRRYRIGVRSTIEALKTVRGYADANAGMLNAFMSIRETQELACFRLLVTERQHYSALAYANGVRYPDMAAALATETRLFNAVGKHERGLHWIAEEVKKTMAAENETPNVLWVPEGMLSQVKHQAAETEYYRAGPDARAAIEQGADATRHRIAELEAIVVRAMYRSKTRQTYSPLRFETIVGSYFKGEDLFLQGKPYRSSDRTVFAYSAETGDGDFVPVTLRDFILACSRWDASDEGYLRKAHAELAENATAKLADAHLSIANGYLDPFLYRRSDDGSYGVASVIGQVPYAALPDDTLSAYVASVAAVLAERTPPGTFDALRTGEEWMRRLYERDATAADAAFAQAIVAASGRAATSGVASGNVFGGHDITVAALNAYGPAAADIEPYGYGSITGMRTIGELEKRAAADGVRSRLSPSLVAAAGPFARALVDVARALKSVFSPAHPLLSAKIVPAYARSSAAGIEGEAQDLVTAFAMNVVDRHKFPLYVRPAAAVAAGVLPAAFEALDAAAVYASPPRVAAYSPAKQAAIGVVREQVRLNATPELRATFATSTSFGAFLGAYEQSEFARAFAARDGAADPTDVSFGTLADALIDLGADVNTVNVLTHVVRIVARTERAPAGSIVRALEAWAAVRVPPSGERLGDSAEGFVLSRLVAPYTALRALPVPAGAASPALAMASPLDLSKRFVGTPEQVAAFVEDSRINIGASTLVERALVAADGRKRRADEAFTTFGDDETEGADSLFSALGGVPSALATSVASTVVAGRVRGALALNVELVARYRDASVHESDVLRRAAALAALLAPITRRQLLLFDKHHVRVPFDFVAMRPLTRLSMHAVIAMRAGDGFGVLAYRETDVQYGHSAANRGVFWNITTHFAPIIFAKERYLVQRNVRAVGLAGGLGLKPFVPETFNPAAPDRSASVMYALVGSRSLSGAAGTPAAFDWRGYFDTDMTASLLTPEAAAAHTARPHYDSAPFYSTLFSLADVPTPRAADRHTLALDTSRTLNTMLLKEKHFVASDAAPNGTRVVPSQAHLGDLQPGSAADLRGGLSTQVRVDSTVAAYTPK